MEQKEANWEKIGEYFNLYHKYKFDSIKAGVEGKEKDAEKLMKKSRYYQTRHDNLFHKVISA